MKLRISQIRLLVYELDSFWRPFHTGASGCILYETDSDLPFSQITRRGCLFDELGNFTLGTTFYILYVHELTQIQIKPKLYSPL